MKTTLALLLVVAALTVSAQTNFDVLICKNASYTNATITRTTPAYAVVSYDGGLVKVAMTNLPDALQKQFGYDPVKAAAILDAEKQKRLADIKAQAERQKYIASLRGSNQVIRVVTLLDGFGQCLISSSNVIQGGYARQQQVYLLGLPAQVSDYLNRFNQLKIDVADYQVRVDNYQRAADAAYNSAPSEVSASGDASFVASAINSASVQMADAGQMEANADAGQKKLHDMKSDLENMAANLIPNSTVIAYPTGLSDNGMARWQCVGVAGSEDNPQ
jgi:hypothetical protein